MKNVFNTPFPFYIYCKCLKCTHVRFNLVNHQIFYCGLPRFFVYPRTCDKFAVSTNNGNKIDTYVRTK